MLHSGSQKAQAGQKCFVCAQVPGKLKQCSFCAKFACEVCLNATRAYPEQVIFDNMQPVSGHLCKVCDRKFLMHDF